MPEVMREMEKVVFITLYINLFSLPERHTQALYVLHTSATALKHAEVL